MLCTARAKLPSPSAETTGSKVAAMTGCSICTRPRVYLFVPKYSKMTLDGSPPEFLPSARIAARAPHPRRPALIHVHGPAIASAVGRGNLGAADPYGVSWSFGQGAPAPSDAAEGSLRADRMLLRAAEIMGHPATGSAGVLHLQTVHEQLFRGFYGWAGQRRDFDSPGSEGAGRRTIAASRLDRALEVVFAALADDNRLIGLEREAFLPKLAYHYDQVHYLHPFVTGNGIAERLFWSQVAHRASYTLEWNRVTAEDFEAAARLADDRDYSGLVALFDRITLDRA